jgi:hypothetical protein
MTLLVRALLTKRAQIWAAADDAALWKNGAFPFEILTDLHDPRGPLSLYEVRSRRDPALIRIAAALHFPKGQTKQQVETYTFRGISPDEFEKLGIEVKKTPGDTADAVVNDLHREIPTTLTGPQAVKLARLMCRNSPVIFSANKIARAISDGIRSKTLPDANKDLLQNLIKEKAVKITYLAA